MIALHSPLLTSALTGVLATLSLSLVLAFVRLLRGPSLADRVVALDLISTIVAGSIAALAIVWELPVLLDAAIVMALISFLGTVAFARYIEKGVRS
jgi:multicomponent Na+:H+ antiporter subunit F